MVGNKKGGRLAPKTCDIWEAENPATPHSEEYIVTNGQHEADSFSCDLHIKTVVHLLFNIDISARHVILQ